MNLENAENSLVKLVEKRLFRRAIARGNQILQSHPKNLTAHFQLGLAHFKRDRVKDALFHGKNVLAINPKERNANLNVGVYYRALGRPKLAKRYLEKELKCYPFSIEPLFHLGKVAFGEGDYAQAARFLNQCFERRYMVDEVVQDLCDCYYRLNDLDNEIRVYLDYLDRDSGNIWALGNAGSALLQAGNPRKALLLLKQANRLDPSDEKISRNLAKAVTAYRESERVGPGKVTMREK
jgi:tetratricopeptide (TPR) repeat protein